MEVWRSTFSKQLNSETAIAGVPELHLADDRRDGREALRSPFYPEIRPDAMTKPLLNIVLHEPEIPQNTGNIGRTCVAVGAKLWLIEPIGYSLDDKYLRRAGMDYWQYLDYQVVGSWEEARQLIQPKNIWYLTKKATKLLWEASFEPGDVLLFGSESKGLPPEIRDEQPEHNLRLPTTDLVRSLNLASTVNTTVYEAVRQFGGLPE